MPSLFLERLRTTAGHAASLRRRQDLIVASVLIFMLTLATFGTTVVLAARQTQQELEYELQKRAATFARMIDRRLQVYEAALLTIAQSHALRGDFDLNAVAEDAQRVGDLFGGWFVVATGGETLQMLLITSEPDAQLAEPEPRVAFPEVVAAEQESIRLGHSVVSDAFPGRVVGESVVSIASPIDNEMTPTPFIYFSVTLNELTAQLMEIPLLEGEFAAIMDGSRRVIARSFDNDRFQLAELPDWYLAFLKGRNSGGTAELATEGDSPRLFAMQRLETAPRWTVTVSRPLPSVISSVYQSAWPGLITLLVLLVSIGISVLVLDIRKARAISNWLTREASVRTHLLEEIRSADTRKSRLMAVLGHDLRTPLVALLGALDVLRRNISAGEPLHILKRIQDDGHGMLQLIDDILELSQLGEGELRLRLEPFSPNALLGEVADLVRPPADKKETDVEVKTNKSMLLMGDISALRRILVNFATNAVKATRSGTITLALEEGKSGPDGREITFAITDTGCGISANDIPSLFRDFGRLDQEDPTEGGTGLGLAICRRLATAMGGEVGVDSTKGRGSRFWLKITLAEAPDAPNALESEDQELTQVLSGLRVLVVEDHQMTRYLTSTSLARYGALTTKAVDGLEAVERAETERFDLILMDMQMPRLDGAEAAARIRDSNGPSTAARIIGITAHQSPDMASILSNLSLDACLSKPLDLQALAALLRDEALPQSNKDTTEDFNTDKLADLRQIDGGELLSKSLRALNEEIRMVRIDLPLLINSDIIAAGRLAHKLAGFCDFLGAQTLANELRRFETQSKNADTEGLFRTLNEMDTLMAATQKKVDQILNKIETDLIV